MASRSTRSLALNWGRRGNRRCDKTPRLFTPEWPRPSCVAPPRGARGRLRFSLARVGASSRRHLGESLHNHPGRLCVGPSVSALDLASSIFRSRVSLRHHPSWRAPDCVGKRHGSILVEDLESPHEYPGQGRPHLPGSFRAIRRAEHLRANNAFERDRGTTWAASGRDTVIVAGRSTRSLERM
jgi:hypothetical protein